jgi:acyl-CoA synthetase (AMP-forming)/AMP-acid ligase II
LLSKFSPTVLYTVPDLVPTLIRLLRQIESGRRAEERKAGEEGEEGEGDEGDEERKAGEGGEGGKSGETVLGLVSLKRLILGGGHWRPSIGEALVRSCLLPKAQVFLFYGSAECSFIGRSSPGEWPAYRPFASVELQMKDEELWVRSPMTLAPGQWLPTGDRVRRLPSEDAFEIIGRCSRCFKHLGAWVSPEPIEAWLMEQVFDGRALALLPVREGGRAERLRFTLAIKAEPQGEQIRLADALQARYKMAFPSAPAISRTVDIADWPVVASGKTDYLRLAHMVQAEPGCLP